MLAMGMIIGSPLLSYFSNTVVKSRKIAVIMSTCRCFLPGLPPLAFFTAAIPLVGHYIICLGLGIFSSAIVVIGFTTNKELFPVQMAGTATGMINLFPFSRRRRVSTGAGLCVLEKQGRVEGAFTLEGYQQAFLVLFACSVNRPSWPAFSSRKPWSGKLGSYEAGMLLLCLKFFP